MDWKKLHYLIWFLPAYLLFQGIYQVIVYKGMVKTYAEGVSYMANVDYFRINDMQAQTNGVIIAVVHHKRRAAYPSEYDFGCSTGRRSP